LAEVKKPGENTFPVVATVGFSLFYLGVCWEEAWVAEEVWVAAAWGAVALAGSAAVAAWAVVPAAVGKNNNVLKK
jgi:hypothetical protein